MNLAHTFRIEKSNCMNLINITYLLSIPLFLLLSACSGKDDPVSKYQENHSRDKKLTVEFTGNNNERIKAIQDSIRPTSSSITPVMDSSNSFVSQLIFQNKTGRVVTFDVIENNPYQNLMLPVLKRNNQGNRVFNLKKKTSTLPDSFFISQKYAHQISPNHTLSKADSRSTVYKGKNHTVVAYNLLSYNTHNELIGHKGTALILNGEGEITRTFYHLEDDIRLPLVNNDGGHLAFLSGGAKDINGWGISSEKFHLLNTVKGKKLLEIEATENESFSKPYVLDENKIVFESDIGYSSSIKYKFWIIDIKKQIIFTKSFDKKIRNKLSKIDSQGLLFSNGRREDFEQSFDQKKY